MLQGVPTLHIRNVPEDVYEELRRSAARNGRSMNAEVVVWLRTRLDEGWQGDESWWDSFVARGERIKAATAAGSPKPEDIVRQARDER